jgi:hypothetical protein
MEISVLNLGSPLYGLSHRIWGKLYPMENLKQLDKSHVHVLLFKCPESGEPMTAAILTASRSLEDVDSCAFEVKCNCGWSGSLLGIERVKNWVEEWGKIASY